jgi:ribose transport system ATP-binding protein
MRGEYLLEAQNIHKSFGSVHALQNIDFQLAYGTTTCLLGKNGAGKSCLAKIVAGLMEPDAGQILFEGNAFKQNTSQESRASGIYIIPQDLTAYDALSVAENIFMDRKKFNHKIKDFFGIVNWREIYTSAFMLMEQYDLPIDPERLLSSLSMGEKQIVMILRAISQNAKLIVMDEATTALNGNDIDKVYKIMKRITQDGTSFLYITHNPNEVYSIAERVMILTDGQLVLDTNIHAIKKGDILQKMVGDEVAKGYPRLHIKRTYKLLQIDGLKRSGIINNVGFSLYGGEILGLTGLLGAGRTSIAKSICGIEPFDQGAIYVRGLKINKITPRIARRLGIAYFPEDRADGLYGWQWIKNNISISNLSAIESIPGVISREYETYIARYYIDKLAIQCAGELDIMDMLSGGNQQKVMFSKWIFANSDILILDEPTKGMDIPSKVEVYNIMNELKRLGKGLLFISSDIQELIGMCDRLLVLKSGSIICELTGQDLKNENVLYYATTHED